MQNVGEDYRGTLSYVPSEVSGQALVIVEDEGQEYCGGGSITIFYSYDWWGSRQSKHILSPILLCMMNERFYFQQIKALVIESWNQDIRFEFIKEENHFVRWQMLSGCESCQSSEYEKCLKNTRFLCLIDCTAVSVRKIEWNMDSYILYSDNSCVAEHKHSDIHWDFYSKETFLRMCILRVKRSMSSRWCI